MLLKAVRVIILFDAPHLLRTDAYGVEGPAHQRKKHTGGFRVGHLLPARRRRLQRGEEGVRAL
jgi:hypothetical protein